MLNRKYNGQRSTTDNDNVSVGGKNMDTTATSDFLNRFKGKMEIMKTLVEYFSVSRGVESI